MKEIKKGKITQNEKTKNSNVALRKHQYLLAKETKMV